MFYVLCVLTILAIIIYSIVASNSTKADKICGTICTLVIGIGALIIAPLIGSYISLAKMNGQKLKAKQYQQILTFYSAKGATGFSGVPTENVITDLKFQNYQSKLAEMAIDLRDLVSSYNQTLAEKLTWKKTLWFRWMIFVPEDQTPLELDLDLK